MEEEKELKTYFIYTKEFNGEVTDFVGPLFEQEINDVRTEEFKNEETEVIDESLFKSLFYENYVEDFNDNWSYYISAKLTYFNLPHYFACIEEEDKIEGTVYEDIVLIVENFGSITKEGSQLVLNINLDANPHFVALVCTELTKYCDNIMEVVVSQPTYINNKNELSLDEEAYNVFNMEKLGMIFMN